MTEERQYVVVGTQERSGGNDVYQEDALEDSYHESLHAWGSYENSRRNDLPESLP